jgi:phenylacetate-CoA ligase
LQVERLRWQVERCYHRSAFYRERFDKAGAHPDILASLDDIRRFPFVTKQELRDEQARHPYFGRYTVAPQSEWREIHPITGTTGKPVHTIWSAEDVAYIADMTARMMWSFGVRPGDIVQNAFSYGLWVAGLAGHDACAQIGCLVVPIGAHLTGRQIDYILGATTKTMQAGCLRYVAPRLVGAVLLVLLCHLGMERDKQGRRGGRSSH